MSQFIVYLTKLSGTLIILYLFYWIVLRHLTFYTCNRWYLLGYSIAAFFIPLIDISPFLEKTQLSNDELVQWVPVLNTEGLDQNMPVRNSNQLWHVSDLLMLVVSTGIVLMVIRFIIQYFSVRSVRKTSHLLFDGEVKVYHSDRNIIPFSFGNSIFINKNKHSEDDLSDIIRHEFIHVKQKHTLDILLSEWICILNWYNPFAWLLRNAIRQNLEFIADSKVLQNGVDKKQYQYLLLKVVGAHQYGMATSFNFTSLKKRIAMMNKMRSTKLHLVKFLFVLPLLAMILLAFRNNSSNKGLYTGTISNDFILPDRPLNETLVVDTVPSSKKSGVRARPPHIVRPNSKGYIITVADNQGECIVLVRDKQNKIVKALSLVEWNENEKEYKSQYGEIRPPIPPTLSGAPLSTENISSIEVKNNQVSY